LGSASFKEAGGLVVDNFCAALVIPIPAVPSNRASPITAGLELVQDLIRFMFLSLRISHLPASPREIWCLHVRRVRRRLDPPCRPGFRQPVIGYVRCGALEGRDGEQGQLVPLGDDPLADRVQNQLGDASKVQLLHDVGPVGFDGVHTEIQQVCHLLV